MADRLANGLKKAMACIHGKDCGTAPLARISLEVMGIDERLTHEIVRRVLTAAKPDRIILFGSAATGSMTSDSDIDLLIVEPAPVNRHEESVKIRTAIGDIGYAVDVIVVKTERFEATKYIFGGIAYPAHKYGKVLYEAR